MPRQGHFDLEMLSLIKCIDTVMVKIRTVCIHRYRFTIDHPHLNSHQVNTVNQILLSVAKRGS